MKNADALKTCLVIPYMHDYKDVFLDEFTRVIRSKIDITFVRLSDRHADINCFFFLFFSFTFPVL